MGILNRILVGRCDMMLQELIGPLIISLPVKNMQQPDQGSLVVMMLLKAIEWCPHTNNQRIVDLKQIQMGNHTIDRKNQR